MSESNVEVVRRLIELVNDGQLDAAVRGLAPDATLDWSESEAPDGGVYLGPQAWSEWMSGRSAELVGAHFDVTELVELPPDRVLLVAYMRGRGRASGLEIEALGGFDLHACERPHHRPEDVPVTRGGDRGRRRRGVDARACRGAYTRGARVNPASAPR